MAEKADGNPTGRSRADKGMRGRVPIKNGFSEAREEGVSQFHAPAGGVLLPRVLAARCPRKWDVRGAGYPGTGRRVRRERSGSWVLSGGGPGSRARDLQLGESEAVSLGWKLGCCRLWGANRGQLVGRWVGVGLPAQPITIGHGAVGRRGAKPCGLWIPN